MKQFKITKGNKDYIIKASNSAEAVKKLRDAQSMRIYLDKAEIEKIESEARSIKGNWVSVVVIHDVDNSGYYIEEMYVSTTGTWLYKLSDIKEYTRQLENAAKFMNKYEKYAENKRA